jgi:hypothetical protein
MSSLGKGGIWQVGDWVVDASDDSISRGGESTKLEPRMMRLLLCLLETPGDVVNLEKLLAQVWPGVIVGPASVYQAVSQLRRLQATPASSPPASRRWQEGLSADRAGQLGGAERRSITFRPTPAPAVTPPVEMPQHPAASLAIHHSGSAANQSGLRDGKWWAVSPRTAALIAIAWAPLKSYLTEPASRPPSIVVPPFADMTTDKSTSRSATD